MTTQTIEATGPSHWASYLVNGDASGIDDSERALADRFVTDCLAGLWPVDCSDAGFMWVHDAGGLGADCQTYVSIT